MRSGYFSIHYYYLIVGISVCMLASACNAGSPQKEEDELRTDGIFLDYQATGDESMGEITVRLQFRAGGPDGKVMLLDTPAAVHFDGKLMEVGHSKMNGGYYEATFPADDSSKLHEIGYRDSFGKTYKDTFHFPFFSLEEEVPESVSRANALEIKFSGLRSVTSLHTMLTDTSFYGRGIDRMDTISAGKLILSPQTLAMLKNGPIHLEFYREEDRLLERNGQLRGRLYLSYNIGREFVLND